MHLHRTILLQSIDRIRETSTMDIALLIIGDDVFRNVGGKMLKVPANKNSVKALDGVDKKAFSAFLKSNKIKWDEPQGLIKVIEYLVSKR